MRSVCPALIFALSVFGASLATGEEVTEPNSEQLETLIVMTGAVDQSPALLSGRDARLQLLVSSTVDGRESDVTREAAYSAEPDGILRIDSSGYVTPVANGTATVSAKLADGKAGKTTVCVENIGSEPPIHFANQVVPLFSKYGCNGGGCHGKASGQNGFRLSLLGFTPKEDYEFIVKESRGRRVFVPSPEHSLLLQKAVGSVPHGGGARIPLDSYDYRILSRWIAQGMPQGESADRTLVSINVFPRERLMLPQTSQQLQVIATWSDDTVEDITRTVQYESSEKEMGTVDMNGLLTVGSRPGDVNVMMRFSDQVAIFQAMIPLGAPVDTVPASNSFIDDIVFAKLKRMGIPPSDLADDATFLRRTSIDIAGRLPTLDEANAFQADTSADKRTVWIEKLIADPGYADNFAAKWSALLRNKRRDVNARRGAFAMHAWIRESLYNNVSFDKFAKSIVTASGETGQNPAVVWYREVDKQEELVEDTAQLFLGQRLKCARCHHHPFEKWSQDDYYSFAAFFSRIGKKAGRQPGENIVFHNRGNAAASNPVTGVSLKPAPLAAEALTLSQDDDPRIALADWMIQNDNAFFARTLVNRYWKHFLGTGLVEPEDDLRQTNPATNPQLLDALAKHFVDSGYDLKQLVRTITNSTSYQLSSIPNAFNAVDKQNYSHYYTKRLPAEVLLDAVDGLTASNTDFAGLPANFSAMQLPDDSYTQQSYFLTVFGRPSMESACECERSSDASLTQSLHLLNSTNVAQKVSADTGRAANLAADEKRQHAEKITELYLRAYSRNPTADEVTYATQFIEAKLSKGKDDAEKATFRRQAYEDVVWALLSTKEFLFNH